MAMATLVGIPLLVLSIAALAGYPLLTGDNLVQNYPLSVLAGEIIAHGHLPVYDPFLWAGLTAPRRANAHALLPSTLLFAFLPALAAWVLAEALTLGAGAIGAFVLLRRNSCRTLAAGLGGASFGLGGFVSSQVVHIDFVSAAAAVIWSLVALDAIFRGKARWRAISAVLLAAGTACVALSGSPDIVIDAAVAIVVYGAHLLITAHGRRLVCLCWTVGGGLTGVAIGAVQWLPTARFLAISERAHASYAFAASGSVSAAELLVSVVPHLLGGGPVGMETYVGPYNLAELDAYGGILSLVAILALATRWRSEHASRWRVWYLIGAFGVLLALGSHTPLERVIQHFPVVGEQRLPSRALILFSLASSMLLGFFIEDQLSRKPGRPGPAGLVGAAAPVAVLGLVIATVVTGRPYGGLLRAVAGSHFSLRATAPYLVVTCVIALAAVVVVLLGPNWPRRRLAWALSAVVVADLLVFTANQSSLAPAYSRALETTSPLRAQLSSRLGRGGRYLIVDPARSAGVVLDEVGGSDFNLLSDLQSAQGYGSLTWGPYASATGTHSQDDVDPAALLTGTFDSLDVRVLLTVPDELSVEGPEPESPGSAPASTPGLALPAIAGVEPVRSPIYLRPGESATRWFGRSLVLTSVELKLTAPLKSAETARRLGRSVRLVSASRDGAPYEPVSVSLAGRDEIVVHFAPSLPGGRPVVRGPHRERGPDRLGEGDHLGRRLLRARRSALGLSDRAALGAGRHDRALRRLRRHACPGAFSAAPAGGGTDGELRVSVVSSSAWTPTETVARQHAAGNVDHEIRGRHPRLERHRQPRRAHDRRGPAPRRTRAVVRGAGRDEPRDLPLQPSGPAHRDRHLGRGPGRALGPRPGRSRHLGATKAVSARPGRGRQGRLGPLRPPS